MNDKQELTKGDMRIWSNIYLASFSYGEEENMAMQGLYGIPTEDAVRITIPGKVMREWIRNVNRVYRVDSMSNEAKYALLSEYKNVTLTCSSQAKL